MRITCPQGREVLRVLYPEHGCILAIRPRASDGFEIHYPRNIIGYPSAVIAFSRCFRDVAPRPLFIRIPQTDRRTLAILREHCGRHLEGRNGDDFVLSLPERPR